MNLEVARVLVAAGFFMLLLFLRLEADRFGTAEYDKPFRRRADILTWLSWYAIGGLLLATIFAVHPQPRQQLFLIVGHAWEALAFGVPLAVIGVALAVAYAQYRYGYLRLPSTKAYPRVAVNSLGTAIVDEAIFRGIVLGALVTLGLPNGISIVTATVVYLLATRLAAPGRRHFLLLPAVSYGLLGGWATLATGGLGAAIVFHAVTSFTLFLCIGQAAPSAAHGREPEALAARRAPDGWRAADGSQAADAAEWLPAPRVAAGTVVAAPPSPALMQVRASIGKLVHRAGHV
jgi:membrane protease YdiL (CAAX protease family)